MAKKIKIVVKLAIMAGSANPAPPVGTALGPHGIKIMDFCNEFNEKTKDMKGSLIPSVITIYEDRSFDFFLKKPPVSDMIKKATGIEKGSGTTGREKIAKITDAQITKIAQDKMDDLNTKDLEAAKRMVIGTAKSMGLEITK
ncbi:50S ribosomal protein L11 [Candidatus Shapirobacteria bacterium RIFOXYD1_FULL_38_32]|uniref:Large ribosomal subunit protein uL11 n=2 Tax=Candidatus Shapironibacteriota TaxID=1752721 RepID=A0A0G0NYB2_9BACT|nr:MAG: 50S ribosomal protein L11 [Candidatus Shapirobacteria bacterium GW2011_GWE1_38_92]OGL55258.1 MAG: 50S ribosomal protein L11 [Candidatus Shapirobacteria bacterium RIFOXYA1_FULL_39_17]OGL58351.1 MAG: 50S ribosomal protein L11 [Candidatus Shapirobacteria bacterium RIFOXYD1_FULL_38_32]HAP37843.1 50S ribosomal protein L11 [Candidatus Shapirobacteria bacterium]HCU55206.1 50S ribosomal protein L11 [Candidatus Shapirobacteria bacterium]